MATTTNYGWTTPDDTALVKDGAAAIRTLGSSVDTTTKNLNPETTLGDLSFRSSTSNVNTRIPIGSSGQHLTVVAGVPAWSTASDQTPLTTKGDLFTFSTLDARLAVGTNTHVLTADSAEATGLKWAAPASGGMTVIASGNLSGSSVDLTTISQDYKNLQLILRDFYATNVALTRIRVNNNSTSNNYRQIGSFSSAPNYNTADTAWYISDQANVQDNTSAGNHCVFNIFDYANTTTKTIIQTVFGYNYSSGASSVGTIAGYWITVDNIDQINIAPTSGTWSGGSYVLYGVK